jgi:6-hydroxytryprostatin B O-methyltransferase
MSSITTTESLTPAVLDASVEKLTLQNPSQVFKSTLEEFADQIPANAKVISDFLRSNGLPLPSFERDAPTTTIPASAPSEVRAARQKLMEGALRTFQLALGPSEYLPNLAVGVSPPVFLCVKSLYQHENSINMLRVFAG